MTGTENLSATLPRQLEGRTKKRQPGHLDLAEVGILRGSFGNPSESCWNFGNLRIPQLLGSFGNPSESVKTFGHPSGSFGILRESFESFWILRDPSGILESFGNPLGSFEILRVPSKFFGFPGDPLGILWNPSRVLWNPLGSFGNPSGSFRNPLRIFRILWDPLNPSGVLRESESKQSTLDRQRKSIKHIAWAA